jgi:hypothetical protein
VYWKNPAWFRYCSYCTYVLKYIKDIQPSFQTKDVAFEKSMIILFICYQMTNNDSLQVRDIGYIWWWGSKWAELTRPICFILSSRCRLPCPLSSRRLASASLVCNVVGVGGEWLFEWIWESHASSILKATSGEATRNVQGDAFQLKRFACFFLFWLNVLQNIIFTHTQVYFRMSPEVRPVRFDVCLDCVLSTLCLIVVLQCGVVSAASGRDAYSGEWEIFYYQRRFLFDSAEIAFVYYWLQLGKCIAFAFSIQFKRKVQRVLIPLLPYLIKKRIQSSTTLIDDVTFAMFLFWCKPIDESHWFCTIFKITN